MSEQKIIAVVGATGAQGGGLVRAILADRDGGFAVRAITRNTGSAKARALAELGAEVVAADLDDEAALRAAFEGAYGAFVVTNFWEQRPEDDARARTAAQMELAQAGNAARAAKAAGVRHLIWSTLEDTRPFFGLGGERVPTLDDGTYTVPHFDAKAEADDIFREAGVPTTFLRTSLNFDVFLGMMAPRRDEQGALVLALAMGDAKLSGIASEDVGRTAYGILRRGGDLIGQTIAVAGDHLTGEEYAAAMGRAFGEPVTYYAQPFEQLRQFSVETANMFQYYAENEKEFVGARDLGRARELNPELQSFEAWLAAHADAVPRG
ncbi:NmrA/HSCARG family protein [Streptomyces griseocarneus]|uniref:NmrA/HSCARG family protein n=1 Tax=Streptomyces griseocarneus TaxID=51201 RepID=UPI00167C4A15|nr:NmrA/HSCARG family protein [Streptomyces griseocarneus]MBZ6474515.1 NmrA/HSCARG family protein [Streptomyces griseocarneus]GHG67832.1 nucleotide-diphosphate-sugar epimerase [Streptomyces griseocarneus]